MVLHEPQGFGRVYASYGGVFILTALLWGWMKGDRPDLADWCGVALCVAGSLVIKYWPR